MPLQSAIGSIPSTQHAILVGEGTLPIQAIAVGTNGQVLLGSTGADPTFVTPTAGTGLTLTSNASTLQYAITTPVGIANGGTNATSIANTNGTIYFTGTKFASVSPGTTGQVLTSTGAGAAPTFQAPTNQFSSLILTGAITTTSTTAILRASTNFTVTGPTVSLALYDALWNSVFTATSGNTYSNVYGQSIVPTMTTSGTGSIGTVTGLYINPSFSGSGTGTAASNVYGLFIDAISTLNTTNAYGLYVQTPKGASNVFNSFFGGTGGIGFGASPSTSQYMLISPPLSATASTQVVSIASTFTQSSGNYYQGMNIAPIFSLAGSATTTTVITTEGEIINPTVSSTAGSALFTITNARGLSIRGTFTANSNTAITNVYGTYTFPTISTTGSGVVSNVYGQSIGSTITAANNPIALAYSLNVTGPSLSAGTITNAYSLYVTDPSGAGTFTNKYTAILGTTNSARVGIGTAAPQSVLDVNGGLSIGTYAGVVAAPLNSLIVSGSIGVGTTTLTYPLSIAGDIAATTAGSGLRIKEGSNAKMGIASLTLGTTTVSTTAVTANSRIFLSIQSPAGTLGVIAVTSRNPGTSFTIGSSSLLDTSTVAWIIFEPA